MLAIAMVACARCRFENPEAAAYCASCGEPLRFGGQRPSGPKQGLAIASLVLALASLPLALCLVGILTAPIAIVLGIVALARSTRRPSEYGGRGLAIGGIATGVLCMFVLVPIVAAISIPALLRARVSANEAKAIGDLRMLVSAEVAYAAANRSFYDRPECLVDPRSCIPDYPPAGPTFLEPTLGRRGAGAAAEPQGGYVLRYHAGEAPSALARRAASPTSARTFVFLALPARYGATGTRAFCADDTGRICAVGGGETPAIEAGRCSPSCPSLR